MPSYQGLSVITMLLVSMATQSVESFGGRRKNMAHIFGKRSNYKESGDTLRDLLRYLRTFSTSELQELEYLISPEAESQGARFPLVGADETDYSALGEDNSISQSDMIRLRDIEDIDATERTAKTDDIQKLIANYILNKLTRYEK